MLSEHVEKYSTIYLQVRSSMIFFFFLFLFFYFSSFGHCKLHWHVCHFPQPASLYSRNKKKNQLSPAEICIPTPESLVTKWRREGARAGERGGESSSVHSNNSPSQLSCNDVSFLITNCLFMLQQLPRAANKWLKECLDQAFRPLLFAGCYLVDSDGYSCLVWKRARDGEAVIDRRALGVRHSQPWWPHGFMFPALKGKRWLCLEVGGERKCLRVMKKIL